MSLKNSRLGYCGDLVRRHDADRFMISLMMPAAARPALWALFAFNHEIAKTREVVTDTTIGLIRLQWWRDALADLYAGGTPPPHDILAALRGAIDAHHLPREAFDTLLYAREFDLENVPPASLAGLENYADYTGTPLVTLALRALGQEEPDEATVRAVAVAYGLAGLLRAAPFHAAQRRCYMPADLMAGHSVSERALYDGNPGAGFAAVAAAVGARAHMLALSAAPQNRFLRSMRRLSLIYLGHLSACRFDLFSPRAQMPPPLLHARFVLKPD